MEINDGISKTQLTINSNKDSLNDIYFKKFSIIIPAYNEEKRIKPVLEDLSNYISLNQLPWEIIVAVDGDDGTEDIINFYHNKFPFVRSKKASGRSGMGGGIKRGILASTGEYLFLMDGILKKIGIEYDAWPITKIIIENDLKLKKVFLKLKMDMPS